MTPDTRDALHAGAPPKIAIEEVEARVQLAQANRERRARIAGFTFPALVVVAALVLWEASARLAGIPAYILPPPSQIAAVMVEKMPLLLRHGWVSTTEIVLGFLLSVIVGIPLALATFLWPAFARSVYPLLVSSQAVPKMAVAPLFIVWFGFGLMPKVFIAFLIAFFPIVINTVVGLAAIEPEKIYLARSMGLSGTATFFKIRLPNALPSIFGGLKIAITLAVVGAVVGEFVGGDAGLGYLLMSANGSMDTPLLFAGLVGLTFIGIVLFLALEVAERFAIPWHNSVRNPGTGESG
ncbi:MAG: ABC transporter permease [Betaproteobacteria bacterium]